MLNPPTSANPILPTDFEAQFCRVFEAAGCETQLELATLLGLQQASISDAKRRRSIPPYWLIKLLEKRNINPQWILCGTGAKHLVPADLKPTQEISTRDLFEELMRRALQRAADA